MTSSQKNILPASCNIADTSLDRLLRNDYINKANIDLKAYVAAIAPDSGISPADQNDLRQTLIIDFKKISHSIYEIEQNGAYSSATVIAFAPWKIATDKLIIELSSPNPAVNLIDMQRQLDVAASTYKAYLGAGLPEFSKSIDKAEGSFIAFSHAYSAPGTSVSVLSDLQTNLVNDLQKVHTSGNNILHLIGEWASRISYGADLNVVLAAANTFVYDTTVTPPPTSFPIDLKNLGDALTFAQSFVESRVATLDLSNLIGICVKDIMLIYND